MLQPLYILLQLSMFPVNGLAHKERIITPTMATPPMTVGTAMAISRFFLASAWAWADSLDMLATVTLCNQALYPQCIKP